MTIERGQPDKWFVFF